MRRSEQDDCGQHRHEDRRYGHHQEGVAAEACLCLFSGVLRLALSAANGIDDSDLHNGQNRRRDQNGIRHPGEVRGNEGAVYEPHHAERRTAVHGDHEELGRIGMVDQIEYRENGQDHIKRLDRSDADVADCAHADRHDNACDQQIASADNAAGAVSAARALHAEHDQTADDTDDADGEQDPGNDETDHERAAVVEQALKDHQHQNAEQAHAEHGQHLVCCIFFLRNWLFAHIAFCQRSTLPLFTYFRLRTALLPALRQARSHTAGCACRAKRSKDLHSVPPAPLRVRSRPPDR